MMWYPIIVKDSTSFSFIVMTVPKKVFLIPAAAKYRAYTLLRRMN